MKLKKWLLSLLAILLLLALAAYAFRAPLAVAIAARMAPQMMRGNAEAELPDGLHAGLCGAGSPMATNDRNGPCTLVLAGKRLFVFDAGSGGSRTIGRMGFNQGKIEAIFLTHFHSDHIDGLGELMLQRWLAQSNSQPVPVHGAPGVDQVVGGFMQAYGQDQHYRVTHHGAELVPPTGFGGQARPFVLDDKGRVVVLKDADLEIVAFLVDHGPVHPSVGYRISYKGRSLVISGDTKKSAAVQREAQGVDLLIHEAMSMPMMAILQDGATQAGRPKLHQLMIDVMNYHSSPEEAAETARDAKVGYLLLNHVMPPLPLPGLVKAFLGDAPDIFSGKIRVGADGDFISLPAGSKQIDVSRRLTIG